MRLVYSVYLALFRLHEPRQMSS